VMGGFFPMQINYTKQSYVYKSICCCVLRL